MTRRRLAIYAFALAAVAGCDTFYTVRGRVVERTAGTATSGTAGVPVAGVAIRAVLADKDGPIRSVGGGTSNDNGEFEFAFAGPRRLSEFDFLELSKLGYVEKRIYFGKRARQDTSISVDDCRRPAPPQCVSVMSVLTPD